MNQGEKDAFDKLPKITLTRLEATVSTIFSESTVKVMAGPLTLVIETGKKVLDTIRPALDHEDPMVRKVAAEVMHDGEATIELAERMLAFKKVMAERGGISVKDEEAKVLKQLRKDMKEDGTNPDASETIGVGPKDKTDTAELVKAIIAMIAGGPPGGISSLIQNATAHTDSDGKHSFDEDWQKPKSKPASSDSD